MNNVRLDNAFGFYNSGTDLALGLHRRLPGPPNAFGVL